MALDYPDSYGGGHALAGVYGTGKGLVHAYEAQMRDPETRTFGGHDARTQWRQDGAQRLARDAPPLASRSLEGARKSASNT